MMSYCGLTTVVLELRQVVTTTYCSKAARHLYATAFLSVLRCSCQAANTVESAAGRLHIVGQQNMVPRQQC